VAVLYLPMALAHDIEQALTIRRDGDDRNLDPHRSPAPAIEDHAVLFVVVVSVLALGIGYDLPRDFLPLL
jgi:hypothetical protein